MRRDVFGKDQIVADGHADAPDGGVDDRWRVAGRKPLPLGRKQMRLAIGRKAGAVGPEEQLRVVEFAALADRHADGKVQPGVTRDCRKVLRGRSVLRLGEFAEPVGNEIARRRHLGQDDELGAVPRR